MGDLLFVVRKSKPFRFVDLRPDSPTFLETITVARSECLCMLNDLTLSKGYSSESRDRRQAKLEGQVSRVEKTWGEWEDRPAFRTESLEGKAGEIYEAHSATFCDYERGAPVGTIIPSPLPPRRGQPKYAVVTEETYKSFGLKDDYSDGGASALLRTTRKRQGRWLQSGPWITLSLDNSWNGRTQSYDRQYTMRGPTGTHTLAVSQTDESRLEAHWQGFVESNRGSTRPVPMSFL